MRKVRLEVRKLEKNGMKSKICKTKLHRKSGKREGKKGKNRENIAGDNERLKDKRQSHKYFDTLKFFIET